MRKFFSLVCMLLFFSPTVFAIADIGEIGVGARSLGVGNATTTGLDDASSIFTNPAALALNSDLNILSMNGSLLTDVNYLVVGLSNTAPIGRVGVGYINASLGAIPITRLTGTGSTAAVEQSGTTNYSSSILMLSYGSQLSRFLRGKADNISFGLRLKYFLQGFNEGGTSMIDANGVGMDADLGLLWQVNDWSRLGLNLVNFLPERYGGRFIWTLRNVTESIPFSWKLGASFDILGKYALKASPQHLRLMFDYEKQGENGRPAVIHAGVEYWPTTILALRAGLDQKPKASEAGIGVDNNLTAGIGLRYFGFTFDYAFHQFGELTENTTHFFSIGYRGVADDDSPYGQNGRSGILPLAEVVPKPILSSFTDLPEDYWAKRPIEYMASLGIMGGYTDKTFRPENAISRGELAAIMVKAKDFKLDRDAKSNFKDVAGWQAPYVDKAVERNYIKGVSETEFQPNRGITRAEAAVVFARYAGLYVKPEVSSKVFPDVSIKHWAAPSISACKIAGFYEYLSDKYFGPNEPLTRAEVSEVMSKVPVVKEKIIKYISGER
ncbi:MAG: S-layer homology domain-containing protein [bacterium]